MTSPEGAAATGVLVTGANGHLGRRLAEWAADTPHTRVRAVVRSERAAGVLASLPAPPETHIVDYADADALADAATGCDAAVHLVGIIKETPQTRFEDAHEGTCTALAAAAKRAGLSRIVYLSLVGADAGSSNPCLASRGRAEEILLAAPTPSLILRVPMVLGEGDFASRSLLGQARAGWLPLVGGGRTLQQPIDARDVVAAIAAALHLDPAPHRILDLGGPETLSHRALVGRAAALHGRAPRVVPTPLGLVRAIAAVLERVSANPPLSRAFLDVLQHDDRVDSREACKELGLTLTPLDDTLRRCVGPEAPKP
ncbi:MAG: NAD(P)H-binding protein [Proteobacteria bacterium]|nr:NAD(P)H-binding protein [Pseudomonadota bacterium]